MQVKISSKHVKVTPAIEEYASKKIEKFPRYFNRIQQVEVIIDKARSGYTVEIITDVEHPEPFEARDGGEADQHHHERGRERHERHQCEGTGECLPRTRRVDLRGDGCPTLGRHGNPVWPEPKPGLPPQL